jgi:hypothetical protein
MLEIGQDLKDGYGRSVRIIATDAKHPNGPIIGLVTTDRDGAEQLEAYRENGTMGGFICTKRNLILPRRFIDLENALSLIRSRRAASTRPADFDALIADLQTMPFKEITE